MAVIDPIACRCGLTMRVCEARDAWECRCGMWVDGMSVFDAKIDPPGVLPDTAFQQGEPWKEPAPGIRISDAWADIGPLGWEIALVDPATVADNATLERAAIDAFRGGRLRYMERARPTGGRFLVLETGEELRRQPVYALAPLGQEVEALAGIVQFLSDKLLPGRVWTMGEIPVAPMKKRSEDGCRGVVLGGVMHVALGCYYFHKADEATTAKIEMLHRVHIVGVPGNGCPHATGHVGAISRHGVGRYRLRVEGPVGTVDLHHRSRRLTWVSLGGFTAESIDIDLWNSINQPVDLEPDEEVLVSYLIREPYAPGEKMTDRHPDSVVAQVVEETIAAHAPLAEPNLQSIDDKLPGGGSTPIEFARPASVSPELLARRDQLVRESYEHCGIPVAPAPRADGFAQRQVDAAKAALLAPAPPRYPRGTGGRR